MDRWLLHSGNKPEATKANSEPATNDKCLKTRYDTLAKHAEKLTLDCTAAEERAMLAKQLQSEREREHKAASKTLQERCVSLSAWAEQTRIAHEKEKVDHTQTKAAHTQLKAKHEELQRRHESLAKDLKTLAEMPQSLKASGPDPASHKEEVHKLQLHIKRHEKHLSEMQSLASGQAQVIQNLETRLKTLPKTCTPPPPPPPQQQPLSVSGRLDVCDALQRSSEMLLSARNVNSLSGIKECIREANAGIMGAQWSLLQEIRGGGDDDGIGGSG